MTNPVEWLYGVKRMLPKSGALGEVPSTREMYSDTIRIAAPSVMEMVLISLIGSVDTMMVGGIGASAITAVGLCGQPRMIMLCAFFALNIGVTAVVARRKGEGRQDEANRTLRNAILIIIGVSIVLTGLGLAFARPLLALAGAKSDTIEYSVEYFQILTALLPVNALSMCICAALRGVGNTKTTMYVNIASNAVNVLFNYLLIGGNLGFPRLGVRGAAIATGIGFCVGFVLALYAVFHANGSTYLHLNFRDDWRVSSETVKAIGKVSGNALLEQVALRIGFFAYSRIVAELGTLAYAAHQVGMQFLNLSFTFADGIGVAGTSLVGQMMGRRRPDLSQIYGKVAQRLAMSVAIVLGVSLYIFRYQLVTLFVSQRVVVEAAAQLVIIIAIFQPFQTSSVVVSGSLRGAGDTKYVAKVMLACVTIIRPVLSLAAVLIITRFFTPHVAEVALLTSVGTADYFLNQIPYLALKGAWAASLIDMIIRMTLVLRRFSSGKWHNIKL